MNVGLLETPSPAPRRASPRSRGERRLLCSPATWEQFKTLQNYFEQWGGARVSYLDGTLQLMTISFEHESRKSQIARLLEVFLLKEGVEFFIHGSTTLESEIKKAGKEPDESYSFESLKKLPELAIEISITSGGIDTLEIYRRWKIPEVWIWEREVLQVFVLRNRSYAPAAASSHFPKLDLALLARCARIPGFLEARKQFLAGLKKKRRR